MLFGNDKYDSMLFYFADCITYVCLIRHSKSQKKSLFKVPEKIAGSKRGFLRLSLSQTQPQPAHVLESHIWNAFMYVFPVQYV